jgi:hypothetical protein
LEVELKVHLNQEYLLELLGVIMAAAVEVLFLQLLLQLAVAPVVLAL